MSEFLVAAAAAAPVIGLQHLLTWERVSEEMHEGLEALRVLRRRSDWAQYPRFIRFVLAPVSQPLMRVRFLLGLTGFVTAIISFAWAMGLLYAAPTSTGGFFPAGLLVLSMMLAGMQVGAARGFAEISEIVLDQATRPHGKASPSRRITLYIAKGTAFLPLVGSASRRPTVSAAAMSAQQRACLLLARDSRRSARRRRMRAIAQMNGYCAQPP